MTDSMHLTVTTGQLRHRDKEKITIIGVSGEIDLLGWNLAQSSRTGDFDGNGH